MIPFDCDFVLFACRFAHVFCIDRNVYTTRKVLISHRQHSIINKNRTIYDGGRCVEKNLRREMRYWSFKSSCNYFVALKWNACRSQRLLLENRVGSRIDCLSEEGSGDSALYVMFFSILERIPIQAFWSYEGTVPIWAPFAYDNA